MAELTKLQLEPDTSDMRVGLSSWSGPGSDWKGSVPFRTQTAPGASAEAARNARC